MAKKIKEYYDDTYGTWLAGAIKEIEPTFARERFLALVLPTVNQLEMYDRQDLYVKGLAEVLQLSYQETIQLFYQLLGPELTISTGMFTEGYKLWPLGRYVETYGAGDFDTTTAFCRELTKRFTGEYAMRPIIQHHPEKALALMQVWSRDPNQRVRRLASECLRINLPWSKKLTTCLDYFDDYQVVLTTLKDDPDKTIQKSVANNLNDLFKVAPQQFDAIIAKWQSEELSTGCRWIIKQGSRTKIKKA